MALTQTEVLSNGLTLQDAYIKILELSGNTEVITLTVVVYVNKAVADVKGEFFNPRIYSFMPDLLDTAENYHKQGYDYLKTLPEFVGAIDC